MEASGSLAQAAAGDANAETAEAGDAAEDEDVVDAEFEEVEDEDKKA